MKNFRKKVLDVEHRRRGLEGTISTPIRIIDTYSAATPPESNDDDPDFNMHTPFEIATANNNNIIELVKEYEKRNNTAAEHAKIFKRRYSNIANGTSFTLFDPTTPINNNKDFSSNIISPFNSNSNATGTTDAKIKYLRGMVFRYLSCKDPEVKAHIESALMAIFRFAPEEKQVIEESRSEETTDTIASITNFLGETIATLAP